ncbi:RibD family protein [Actinocorallia sp. A-T 12471]|uniref:RibD family protein n=1 Tax=Actinocorallia sp. A-T 12471 TaxID=3089813 RepID=UPI0029D05525|nr:dihydrofolate reductase family protein [Actinocorallia sp. A-T 12471]MDX6739462.1 dihydrofolate reductase family protein [Actinocorallia sp. A-T 12471]
MNDRPYVLLSCATSVDGYIDDTSPERLRLSNEADFDRVDEARAGVDAILVGATTIRRDNPSLLVRSPERRAARAARGMPENLTKVTLTTLGELDPQARFFTTGTEPKIVYTGARAAGELRAELDGVAEVVALGAGVAIPALLADLHARGVRRLMVEGGGGVHTAFLTADLVDEIQLAVAPFFVGDPDAPRFTHPGAFPQNPARPMRLAETRAIGDVAFLRYLVGADDG